jgi:hypothetical protein
MFYKLLKMNIGGNFLHIIQSMYTDVSYSVKLHNGLSDSFASHKGVKQGCVLSPSLFNLFISDLPDIFDSTCDQPDLNNNQLSCLMFADDLVILSKSATGLQNSLDKLSKYCNTWGLQINIKKTKVIIFNKAGHQLKKFKFILNGQIVEMVPSYCYLGIVFTTCGSFTKAVDHLANQASKALFKLKQKDIMNNIPTALKLFDTLILPIIRYGSEVWSPFYFRRINDNNFLSLCEKFPAEKLHTKFCRYLLGVHRKSTSNAVRAELGRRPLLTLLLPHATKYWLQICKTPSIKLVRDAYQDLHINLTRGFNWANAIQLIWTTFSFEEIWHNQGSPFKHKAIKLLIQAIQAKHDLAWINKLNETESKLRTYKLFKNTFSLERYLLLNNVMQRKEFTKLRISAHQLQIEMGRYTVPKKTPLENRICKYCNTNQIEDEKHFLMFCPLYLTERQNLYSTLHSFTSFQSLNDNEQFTFLMSYNDGDMEIFKHISKFIDVCVQKRKDVVDSNNSVSNLP